MSGSNSNKKEQLGTGIRRLIGSKANAHYLRSLPQFHVEPELPADLRSLLKALDRRAQKPAQKTARDRN
jgi:hypothetical protein